MTRMPLQPVSFFCSVTGIRVPKRYEPAEGKRQERQGRAVYNIYDSYKHDFRLMFLYTSIPYKERTAKPQTSAFGSETEIGRGDFFVDM